MEQLRSPKTWTEPTSRIILMFPVTSEFQAARLRGLLAAVLGRACQSCITAVGARLALLTPREVYRDVRISHRAAQRHAKSHAERPSSLQGALRVARQLGTDDSQNYFCSFQRFEDLKKYSHCYMFIIISPIL